MSLTTSEQDKIIEALSVEHGAVKVLPLRGTDALLACGWTEVLDWRVCPHCHGHGQPQGDGSGWDGTSMHTPACSVCDGRGAIPACTTVSDSCHGDSEIEACVCLSAVPQGDLRGPWWYIPTDPAAIPAGGGPDDVPLRYAYEQEIADALEQDAVRDLLSAAGLRP